MKMREIDFVHSFEGFVKKTFPKLHKEAKRLYPNSDVWGGIAVATFRGKMVCQ